MPSATPASGLIKLYFATTPPGLIWTWPAWQEVTSVHYGLFPEDDAELPRGMSRADSVSIKSYFYVYQSTGTVAARFQLATNQKGAPFHPGRKVWNSWVNKCWQRWSFHDLLVKELFAHDVHPTTLLMVEGILDSADLSKDEVWPPCNEYLPIIIDSLGKKIFGDDAFPPGSDILPISLRNALKGLGHRVWDLIRRRITRVKSQPDHSRQNAEDAFAELESSTPTRAKITKAIRAVAKWRDTAQLLASPATLAAAEEMHAQIQAIMESLGAKVKGRVPLKGPQRVSEVSLRTLATEEDVIDIQNVYHDFFEQYIEDSEPTLPENGPSQSLLTAELCHAEADFGVETEASLSPAVLGYHLGFGPNGLPPAFIPHRHITGVTPWDDPSAFSNPKSKTLTMSKLHWHQLAGVHAIVRKVFTQAPDLNHTTGVLVGDEVGLGKTAQALTLLAFLNLVITAQEADGPLPHIMLKYPYLRNSTTIPSRPHLIVCPGTLMSQWASEIKTLFRKNSVDILLYESSCNADAFWGPAGPFQQSKHLPHNRIIIASHAVLFRDFTKTHAVHQRKKKKNARPWDIPESKSSTSHTILGPQYLTIIVDESHQMRNAGNQQLAVLRLLHQAIIRIPMTATPLHTSPKDVASMFRLAGVPHFFTEDCWIEEKEDLTAQRRAKKLDDDGETLLAENLRIVLRLQNHGQHHFLRRTTESKDWRGETLVAIPPYREIIGIINLSEKESQALLKCNEFITEMINTGNVQDVKIQTRKFYMEYRLAVGYMKENPDDAYPTFKSLDEWQMKKGTKLDVAARICQHYMSADDVPDVFFVDGQPIFLPCPAPTKVTSHRRRLIIFANFSSMAGLVKNVLEIHGVPCLVINGKIAVTTRDKIVKQFYDDKHPARVLIISSVGAAGLNLSIADVVLFFDQPWSAQDERQIRGRAHRQPQKKEVVVIHLLARDSADLLMHNVARAKQDMFEAFVDKAVAAEMHRNLRGEFTEAEPSPKPPKKSTKVKEPQVIVINEDNVIDVDEVDEDDLPGLEPELYATSSDGISVNSINMFDTTSDAMEPEPEETPVQLPTKRVRVDSNAKDTPLNGLSFISAMYPSSPDAADSIDGYTSSEAGPAPSASACTSDLATKRPRVDLTAPTQESHNLTPVILDTASISKRKETTVRKNPFAKKTHQVISPGIHAPHTPRSLSSTTPVAGPSKLSAGPSKSSASAPSRHAGLLDDVDALPKSALVGFRPVPRKKGKEVKGKEVKAGMKRYL
ncbi:hypothetical protein C0991_009199 [Blastosporella zonata]|nr:hypothetical protein C0991_009199 [Blastosporella zonata]